MHVFPQRFSTLFQYYWTFNENHWWCFPFWGSYTPGLRGLSTLYSATCREVAVSVATQKQWPLSTRFGWFFDVLVIITFTVTLQYDGIIDVGYLSLRRLIVESKSLTSCFLWVFEQSCWGQPMSRGATRFGNSLHQSEEPWQHMMFFMSILGR